MLYAFHLYFCYVALGRCLRQIFIASVVFDEKGCWRFGILGLVCWEQIGGGSWVWVLYGLLSWEFGRIVLEGWFGLSVLEGWFGLTLLDC